MKKLLHDYGGLIALLAIPAGAIAGYAVKHSAAGAVAGALAPIALAMLLTVVASGMESVEGLFDGMGPFSHSAGVALKFALVLFAADAAICGLLPAAKAAAAVAAFTLAAGLLRAAFKRRA
jgi:hypothetical protein